MKRYFNLIILLLIPIGAFAQKDTNRLLVQLDDIVKNKPAYEQQKENRIGKYKELLKYATSNEQHYQLCDKIYQEYHNFQMDSAEVYALRKLEYAKKMGVRKEIDYSKMCLADVYGFEGMYVEALRMLSSLDKRPFDKEQLALYYHYYRMVYGEMSEFSTAVSAHAKYNNLKIVYRDSILQTMQKNTLDYYITLTDKLIEENRCAEANRIMLPWMEKAKGNNDKIRLVAYTLAMSYHKMKDTEKEEYYLIHSAMADLQLASKEYLALQDLARLLYEKGDLDRAFSYMKCSLEDASFSNARLRTIEVSKFFPVIQNAYRQKLKKVDNMRKAAISIVSVLAICLALLIVYLSKQKNKLSTARDQLSTMNNALEVSNRELTESNRSLTEANYIKEGCISRYIELCSLYIEKMNDYQHSLIKAGMNGNVEALYKQLKSTDLIETELREFYLHFDKTFLELYPSFVEDFNELLVNEGKIYPKAKGQLNTELRIFALIRLGINDSTKIAKFLRYSVTTVYNYRVKVRNSAKGDRTLLEAEVMKIGQ